MSTIDGHVWSKYSIKLTYLFRSHFQRTLSKVRWVRVGMNVIAYQKKKEETKTGMNKAGEWRRKRPIL